MEIKKVLFGNITPTCLKLWSFEDNTCVATSFGLNYKGITLTENAVSLNKFLVV